MAGLRGERGRLTAAYNADARKEVEPGKVVDWRWGTDENKRKKRDLATLSILKAAPEALAAKLAAIGVCHLLTEQRGFVGLTGPLGGALELLCGVAYRPNTLSKCLAELAVCGAETEFYHAYVELAVRYIRKWDCERDGTLMDPGGGLHRCHPRPALDRQVRGERPRFTHGTCTALPVPAGRGGRGRSPRWSWRHTRGPCP